MNDGDYDIVVVGGGLAGLSAAVASAQRGLKVVVLEQGSTERYLCNSRMAMGFFTVAGIDSRSEPVRLRAAIDNAVADEADPALTAALADHSAAAFDWILGQGVRFIQFGPPGARKPILAPLVPLRAGLNWEGRGADNMLRRLEANLVSSGGRILRGTRAVELISRGGRCTGVVAATGSDVKRYHGAVLLADGGFQADQELVRQHLQAPPGTLLQRNAGSGRGDGLRMAQSVGARIAGSGFYGHVQSRDAMSRPGLWPYPTLDVPATAGIAVDRHGRRFTDEGLGGIALANAMARLDDPLGAFAIFDHAIWEGPARQFVIPSNPFLTCAGGTLHRAETIAELGAACGMDAEVLTSTVERHNDALLSPRACDLVPQRTAAVVRPMPIVQPPFYAAPLCAGVTYTMAGIAIDDHARVRSQDGGIVPGLYAAGSTTGGHEAGGRSGYTGGLTKALVFGLRAAATIAEATRTPSGASR